MEILNTKKTSLFGSALRRPKPDEVSVETPQLFLEQVIFVSGNYNVLFNRNVSYKVKVDSDVKMVTIGNEQFPIINESGVWKKMKHGVGITKQYLQINVTEKAEKNETNSLYLDNHGLETTFPYSMNSDIIENYAQRILDVNKEHIRKNVIGNNDMFSMLGQKFTENIHPDIEIIQENFTVTEFLEIFIPIYETECYDKKKKVAIARIDAVTGAFL